MEHMNFPNFAVSILVLLDDAYRPPGLSERPRTKTVSILVLLDDAYRQLTQGLSLPQDSVSILVLLDDAYRNYAPVQGAFRGIVFQSLFFWMMPTGATFPQPFD